MGENDLRGDEASHTFIFVLTPDSIASEVCGKEIAHAAANNKRLVPIVHRDVMAEKMPKSLEELNWIFFRDNDDFEQATGKLISALDTDLSWVRAHTRLLTRAIEWDANGRNNSFVLRAKICTLPSNGSRKRLLKGKQSLQRCKQSTSSPVTKRQHAARGSRLGPSPSDWWLLSDSRSWRFSPRPRRKIKQRLPSLLVKKR